MRGIHPDIIEALEGRGHSWSDIEKMTADEMFDEYCGWELGDPHWGVTLRRLLDNTRSAVARRDSTP